MPGCTGNLYNSSKGIPLIIAIKALIVTPWETINILSAFFDSIYFKEFSALVNNSLKDSPFIGSYKWSI